MNPIVPIIILNWNGIEDTVECIDSVLKQRFSSFIIYLLDNGSDESNVKGLKEKYSGHPKIKLFFNLENLGFTKAHNIILDSILLEKPGNEYVALLNNDTVVEQDWLGNLILSASENKADIVSSKMINFYDRSIMDNAGHFMLNTGEILPLGHGENVEIFSEPFENFGSCAGASLYSVQMLREIGCFDEFFVTGYEDAELGVRAVILGYKSIFEPSAIVFHKGQQSINKVKDKNYLIMVQLNVFYSYFKLMPAPLLWINSPFFLFKYGAVFFAGILFLRFSFLKIMGHALSLFLFRERRKVLRSRRQFFSEHRPISVFEILKKQQFFLLFDLKRLFKYYILRERSELEDYLW